MEIIRTGQFENMLKKLTEDDGDMLEAEQSSPRKTLKGKTAFNITGDIRIVFKRQGEHRVRFLTIGGHKDVYGK